MKMKTSIRPTTRFGLILVCLGLCATSALKLRSDEHSQRFGIMIPTGESLDLAIFGEGYFQVAHEGRVYYTRHGKFSLNADREICFGAAESGFVLSPIVHVPTGTTNIEITSDGTIGVDRLNQQQREFLGCLLLAKFPSTDDLEPIGNGLFRLREGAREPPILGHPGIRAVGFVGQGLLERGTEVSGTKPRIARRSPFDVRDSIVLK